MKTEREWQRLKWITKRLIFTACILFLGGAALAQDEESEMTEEPQVLETMEVWGTQISSSSVSLGEDQISVKQADHLGDLLRDEVACRDIAGYQRKFQMLTHLLLDLTY